MRGQEMRIHIAHTMILSFLLAAMAGPTWCNTTSESTQASATYQEAITYVDEFSGLINKLQNTLDRSQFELDTLIEELDFDPAQIVQFVSDEIYLELYSGSLRGALGTLLARSGNSLDQSILLATLLKNAGYDAQISRGTLDDDDVSLLIKQLGIERRSLNPIGDSAQFEKVIDEIVAFFGLDETGARESLHGYFAPQQRSPSSLPRDSQPYNDINEQVRFLTEILKVNNIELGNPSFHSQFRSESRDYFWVRYRAGPSETWRDIHVAFGSNTEPSSSISPIEVFTESIPENLTHKVRIEAYVDRRWGGGVETFPVMAAWERPASNLIGESVYYRNHPDGFRYPEGWSQEGFSSAVRLSTTFYPMLNETLADGAMVFDLLGNVVSPGDMSAPQAGVFRTVGSKAGKAAGILSGIGKPEAEIQEEGPTQALLRHWLRITTIAPSGEERAYVRVLAEAKDNGTEQDFKFKESLIRQMVIAVSVGSYPRSYALNASLNQLLSLKPVVYSGVFHGDSAVQEVTIPEDEIISEKDVRWADHIGLVQLLDLGPKLLPNLISYRSEPLIVAKYWPADLYKLNAFTLDIVNNTRMSLKVTDDMVGQHVEANLKLGVWETHAERLSVIAEEAQKFSTISVFEDASSQSIPSLVITQSNLTELQKLDLNETTINALKKDVADFGILVIPAINPRIDGSFGWWRIDRSSGQSLGMTNFGGAVTVEELKLHAVNTLGQAYAAKGYRAALYCTSLVASLGLAAGSMDPTGGVLSASGFLLLEIAKKLGIKWSPSASIAAFLRDCTIAVALRI
jgi:hypothetical protein